MCIYVKRFGGTSTRAYTRTQARGATPELQRGTDTTYNIHPTACSQADIHTQTSGTIGSPILCGRPKGKRGGGEGKAARFF